MLTQLLSNFAAGGITGYITNTLAIKMLFKKYPVVGGGVLASNFEEFVDNISQLVERDLINHATLEHEFRSERFKSELESAIEHLLRHSLYKRFPDSALSDIPGVEESVKSVLDFFEPRETEFIEKLLHQVAAHISLEELIPPDTRQQLTHELFTRLYESAASVLPEIISHISSSDLPVENLLSRRISDLFHQQLDPFLELLLQSIDHRAFETVLTEIRHALELDRLLQELLSLLFRKSLREILGEDRTMRFSKHLMEQFIVLMQSETGRDELTRFSAAGLDALLTIDEPLTDFMSDETSREIIALIERQLPQLLHLIINWIESNSSDLETLIERLIDASLKKGGIRGKVKYSLKAIFLGKVTERFRIIERLTGILGDDASREAHIEKGVNLVLEAISQKSIGDVVLELTSRHWLTPELISRLLQLNLRRASPLIERIMLGELFVRPLASLFNSQWQTKLLDQITLVLKPSSLSAWLKDAQKREQIRRAGNTVIRKTLRRPVGTFVSEDSSEPILKELSVHKASMESLFHSRLEQTLQGVSLSHFLDDQTFAIIRPKLAALTREYKSGFQSRRETLRLHEIFDTLARHNSSAARLSDIAVMGINDNLHFLLEKNVSQTVKNELLAMGPLKLQERVEDFMGAELWPITWLGAGLGAGVGVVLYSVQEQFGALSGPYLYGVIPLVYGATGILTNWVALKMLFRPHEKKSLLGLRVPFTPGIVGKRKPFFAKNMSRFVDETLLTQDAIHDKIITLKPRLIESLKTHIVADNYKTADAFLQRHADYFSREIFAFAYASLASSVNSSDLAEKAVHTANAVDLSSFNEADNRTLLRSRLQRHITRELVSITKQWIDHHAADTLENAIPEEASVVMQRLLEIGIDRTVTHLTRQLETKDPLLHLLAVLAEPLIKQSDSRRISALLPAEMQALFKSRLSDYIVNRLQSSHVQQQVIGFVQSALIDETVHTDKKIGTMFNGALTEAIEENLKLLFDHGFDGIIGHIQSEKSVIISEVITAIKTHNTLASNAFFRISGVFGDIKRFISILIDKEILRFLTERQKQIEATTHAFFEELKEKELTSFGIKNELFNLYAFEPIVQQIIRHNRVAASIGAISAMTIEQTYAATLGENLAILDIHSAHDLVDLFDEEITYAQTHLHQRFLQEHHTLSGQSALFLQTVRKNFFQKHSFNDCFSTVTHADLEEQVNHSSRQFFASKGYALFEQHLVGIMLQEFQSQGIGFLFDETQMLHNLEHAITTLLEKEAFKTAVSNIAVPLLSDILRSLNGLVDERLKHYLLDNGFEAAYDTLLHNMDELVGAIRFKDVIEREINAMHPSELEDMLNSFAKVYFNRLILYGAYGAVFGIPVAFSY